MRGKVDFSKVEKYLKRLPKRVYELFCVWVDFIEKDGWEHTKRLKVYRDHALRGFWKGFRSVSLKWSYRVIYQHQTDGKITRSHLMKFNKVSLTLCKKNEEYLFY